MMRGLALAALLSPLQVAFALENPTDSLAITTSVTVEQRASVTFILGEDLEDDNRYYSEAMMYYRSNKESRTDFTVTKCRSLLEVKNWLETNPPRNDQPWGDVNMVVHSNEWSDLGVSVLPDGPRAAVSTVELAVENGEFTPIPNEFMDEESAITIYGCGLGRNTDLLETLSYAFGGDEVDQQRPIVRSSRYFVFYESERYNGRPFNSERYMADFWYAHYPSFHRPKEERLIKQLTTDYSDVEMDWEDALTRTEPRFTGDSYHYTFRVPIVWYVVYEEDEQRPTFETKEAKKAFAKQQPELMEAIANYGFEFDDFRWTVNPSYYRPDESTSERAIKIIGQCTVVCVLQPLTVPNPNDPTRVAPLKPSLDDTQFYGVARPRQ